MSVTEALSATEAQGKASVITYAASRDLGEACSVTWTPLSKDFTYKINFTMGDWSHTTGVIRPSTTAAYTYTGYTLPLEAAKQIPNATRGDMTVLLATFSDYDGKLQIGSDSAAVITVTVLENENTRPTADMILSPVSTLPSPYDVLYIQGYSKLKATLDFNTKHGATAAASSVTANGKVYDPPCESDVLSRPGKVTVTATVKDSRGFYGTDCKEIDVIPYARPYVAAKSDENRVIAARCDESANFTDSGTYLRIKAKAVYSAVISDGTQNNYGCIKFRYRKEGGDWSELQTILDCKETGSDEVVTPPLLDGALDIESNYQVQIIASDDFCDSVPVTVAIASDSVYMDRPAGGKSMALGGYSTGDGRLDVYWRLIARGGLSLLDSRGDLLPIESALPLPHGQVTEDWDPDSLACGVYIVTDGFPLKSGETVIMHNGVLIQTTGDVGGNVKLQITLPFEDGSDPMYRLNWYSDWSDWRSMKL